MNKLSTYYPAQQLLLGIPSEANFVLFVYFSKEILQN